MTAAAVIWHDLECGVYRADLPLWRKLAATRGDGVILEIGAGTGRVALDLAAQGHRVIALEHDSDLAAELSRRANGLPVEVICADACDFTLSGTGEPGSRVALCIVAMQTVQLFGDRRAFLRCAHVALAPGGLLALALLGRDVQPFDVELSADVAQDGGIRYASAPTALRETADSVLLERRRSLFDGTRESSSLDVTALARVEPGTLAAEGRAAGFAYRGVLPVGATDQHAGSQVVLLEATGR
jgi:SAM-dependent methyltransferase